ncbi:carbohydrate kinase family protein [Alienimonas chondri]|uniref:Sulfofructose kinase n=1 Tax=Alienimonas chondri TaxID=2681879 RepID=A0ABX1VKE4_9PLAN|nr:carbohydrate kinase family protein [Alienimonas chondri]NNJ27890.1 Sulfofructose kinase [Alienimonas chondri]
MLNALAEDRTEASARRCVLGLGLTVVDHQLILPQLPGPDRKTTASAARVQIGGPVPTALVQLAKLGGPAGTLLSAWGADADGAAIEADLAAVGLSFDQKGCRSAPRTGFAQIWVEERTGRRSIAALRPDGAGLTAEVATAAAHGADLLHTDGWPGEAAVAACRAVKAAGGTVSVDLGASAKPEALIELADVLNLPAQALRRLTDDHDPALAAMSLCARGPRLVTITNGSRGCWFAAQSDEGVESGFVPAFPAEAVDTCGAGDAFCGGLLFAVLHDLPPAAAVQFAAATASLKVRRLGNREALPDYAAVAGLLRENEKTPAAP